MTVVYGVWAWWGGQSLGFSIDSFCRPYNTVALALPCECVISPRLHLPKTKWPNHLSRPYNTILLACTCSKLQELKMPSVHPHSRFLPNHHVGYANGGLCLKVLEFFSEKECLKFGTVICEVWDLCNCESRRLEVKISVFGCQLYRVTEQGLAWR